MTETLALRDPSINLTDLKLRLYAEFETWDDFVSAVDEFQKKTFIKLTIITSKKLKTVEEARRKSKKVVLPDTSDDEDETKMKGKRKRNKTRFEYQYLKLTCKHYGRYVSTSKGIRPNQKTAKLECPTFLYASYDHYKDKFIIKQMNIACNHELKDEDVALPKLLQRTITHDNDSSFLSTTPKEKKKYVKIQNRNVIKIPLESPTLGAIIVNVNKRIKCAHEINSRCQAASLTNDDLLSIHSMFADKKKKEQNEMIKEWISYNDIESNNCSISKQLKQSKEDQEGSVLIQFKLPTLDGSLINVCFKAFTSILNITRSRVDEVISDQYGKLARTDLVNKENNSVKNREEETSIATILTSFTNTNSDQGNEPQILEVVDGDNQQLMIIDTVDVPTTENTILDEHSFNHHSAIAHHTASSSSSPTTGNSNEIITSSTIVPVEINEKPLMLVDIPWWKQIDSDDEFPDVRELYGKLDVKRSILIMKLAFTDNDFQLEIYAQPIDFNEYPLITEIHKDYQSPEDATKILEKFNKLAICKGITDPQLKNYANQIKLNSNSTFTYCYYSDSVRSKSCELLYDNFNLGMCPRCYLILDNVQ